MNHIRIRSAAIAAALLVNGSAFAAIASPTNTTTGDGELFFTLFDDTAKVSYTLDLGVLSKTFRSVADLNRPAGVGIENSATPTSSAGQYVATPWTFDTSAGSQFSQFLAASTKANWRFMVTGGDSVGTTGANQRSIVTTISNSADLSLLPSNGAFNTAVTAIDTYLDNGVVGRGDAAMQNSSTAANGAVYGTASDGGYALSTGYFGVDAAGFLPFTTDNAWTERARFVYLARSGSSNLNATRADFFDNDVGFGEFYIVNDALTNTYELQYVLSAVPEPGTYGLMAGGLLLLGAVARRRRG